MKSDRPQFTIDLINHSSDVNKVQNFVVRPGGATNTKKVYSQPTGKAVAGSAPAAGTAA